MGMTDIYKINNSKRFNALFDTVFKSVRPRRLSTLDAHSN